MAQQDGRQRAADAVAAAMIERGWNKADLSEAAGIDYGTVSDHLNYARKAQARSQAAYEQVFGWVPGTYRRIELGAIDKPELIAARDEAVTVSTGTDDLSEWLTRTRSELTDDEVEELWRSSSPVLEALKAKLLSERQRGSRLGDT